MKVKIGEENPEWEKLIPPNQPDNSGIGVNYAVQYLKPLNQTLEDGRKISCKRRGLKITLSIGDQKGIGLMRRLKYGPDTKNILYKALEEAATEAGSEFIVEEGNIYLNLSN